MEPAMNVGVYEVQGEEVWTFPESWHFYIGTSLYHAEFGLWLDRWVHCVYVTIKWLVVYLTFKIPSHDEHFMASVKRNMYLLYLYTLYLNFFSQSVSLIKLWLL